MVAAIGGTPGSIENAPGEATPMALIAADIKVRRQVASALRQRPETR